MHKNAQKEECWCGLFVRFKKGMLRLEVVQARGCILQTVAIERARAQQHLICIQMTSSESSCLPPCGGSKNV